MYLISIYFDEKTNKRIQSYINQVAKQTGNHFMLEGKVPPHITLSSLETQNEQQVVAALAKTVASKQTGTLQWASVGQFFPHVIYIAPVLSEYLHGLSQTVFDNLKSIEGVSISPVYRPFQWMPHATIGKKLSKEEMKLAFETMQGSFGMFDGEVVEIGLAQTNPYCDIARWKLTE